MNIRDQILYEIHGNIQKTTSKEEDRKNFNSFLEGFMEDANNFGLQETIDIYGMLFGRETKDHLVELKESFEVVLNQLNENQLNEEKSKLDPNTVRGMTTWADKKDYSVTDNTSGWRDAGMGKTGGNAAQVTGSAGAHDGDMVAQMIAAQKNTPGILAAQSARDSAAEFAPKFGTGGGLAGLAALWNTIKRFFTGGWTNLTKVFTGGGSIQDILGRLGQFAKSNPLFTGIAGLGGVLGIKALAKTLKVLFGKMGKKAPSKEVQQQLLKQENLRKELEIIKNKNAQRKEA